MPETCVYQKRSSSVVNPISEWVTKRKGAQPRFHDKQFSTVGNPLYLEK